MNTEKLIQEAHQTAIESGFYDCPECEGNGWKAFANSKFPKQEPFQDQEQCEYCQATGINPNRNIGELLMLIVTELSEAVEAHRKNKTYTQLKIDQPGWFPPNQNDDLISSYTKERDPAFDEVFERIIKDLFEIEIADTFIRLFDLCGYMGIKELIYNPDHGRKFDTTIAGTLYNINKTLPNSDANAGIAKNNFNTFFSCMLDFCKLQNIDIEPFIIAKMAYNKTRAHKHGKEY